MGDNNPGQTAPQYRPAPPDHQRRDVDEGVIRCYEIMKIVQIVVCIVVMVIVGILGILWVILLVILDTKDKSIVGPYFAFVVIFILFLKSMGLIGAWREVVCCQVTYAILVTMAFPYSIIPWFIVYGMCNDWGKTRNQQQVHHY